MVIAATINTNWARWIFASVSKHFDDRKGALPLYIEGQHRDTKDIKDFMELRMDGPFITELSRNYFRLFIEINVLVQSALDDTNYHRIHGNVGLVASIFTAIEIFKFGTGVDDDDTQLECMRLIQDSPSNERIQINHFGQIEPDIELIQSTVEGHYEMFLDV